MQEHENRNKLYELSIKIEGRKNDLIKRDRVFYREGQLAKKNRKGKLDVYTFFLFSDQLLYCEKKQGGTFKVHKTLKVPFAIQDFASHQFPSSPAGRRASLSSAGNAPPPPLPPTAAAPPSEAGLQGKGAKETKFGENFSFRILSSAKSFVVCAETEKDKQDWIDDLREVLDAHSKQVCPLLFSRCVT